MTVTEKLLGEGSSITYEPEVTGGWFADLRDKDGRRVETGLGWTQQAALAHALDRLGRRETVRNA